jgi:nucleoside-triphosphatase
MGTSMHIFLTGDSQIGKSTALRRFLEQTNISADGFLTFFNPPKGTPGITARNLYITKFDTENMSNEHYLAACVTEGKMGPFGDVFDSHGRDILDTSGRRRLIVMDELGIMEENSPLFKAAVFRRLDGEIPVTGVIRKADAPFLNAVRAHPGVSVLTVTLENRDETPGELARRFAYLLKSPLRNN